MKRVILITAAIGIALSSLAQPTLEGGVKMYNYKKYKSAQRILTPLAVKDPLANYYLGLSYLDAGNLAKAEYYFQKFPEDAANMSGMARVAFAKKDVASATNLTKDVAAKAKKKEYQPLMYAAEAITYTEGGDLQQAIQWYKDALTKNANDAELHLGLGDTYIRITGGGGEAMNNYEAVTEKDQKNSLVLARIGDLWYDAHNYQSALEFYGKAKDADNSNPLPFKALSKAYERTGKFDKALENGRSYYQLSDSATDDKVDYMELLYLGRNYCDAVSLANELLTESLKPERKIEVTGILGYSQIYCGDSTEALINMRKYFNMENPKKLKSNAYIEFGKLWLKLNNLDSASFYYLKGIKDDTAANKTEIYRQIAEAYKSKKDYCSSGKWYETLIKTNPNTQPLDYFWGVVMYYYCHDFKKAVSLAENFEMKYSDQPSATYWHARSLAAIDSEATEGTADSLYTKWLDKLGPDGEKKPEKKSDVVKAYQYLLLYAYNKKDKPKMKIYMDKLRAVEPNDVLLKQLEDLEKGGGAPPKKAAGKK